MNDHTSILNFLIKRYDLKSYIEIGVQNKDNNFNLINLPDKDKLGVDPDPLSGADIFLTSDDFFGSYLFEMEHNDPHLTGHNYKPIDLVFLDGLHTAEQLNKDFENALRILSKFGFIVMHDTVPEREEITKVPRETKEWTGDCYKFACTLCKYDWIEFKTFPIDYGVTVIWRKKQKSYNCMIEEITWPYYLEQRENLLRYNNELPSWKP